MQNLPFSLFLRVMFGAIAYGNEQRIALRLIIETSREIIKYAKYR